MPLNNNNSARGLSCPTCGDHVDPSISNSMPFCGPRCKQIDLGRWLGEEIGIPLDPERDRQGEPDGEDWSKLDSMN